MTFEDEQDTMDDLRREDQGHRRALMAHYRNPDPRDPDYTPHPDDEDEIDD